MSRSGRRLPEEYGFLVVAERRADDNPLAALAADVLRVEGNECRLIDPIFAPDIWRARNRVPDCGPDPGDPA